MLHGRGKPCGERPERNQTPPLARAWQTVASMQHVTLPPVPRESAHEHEGLPVDAISQADILRVRARLGEAFERRVQALYRLDYECLAPALPRSPKPILMHDACAPAAGTRASGL